MSKSKFLVAILCLAMLACGGDNGPGVAECGDLSSLPIGFDIQGMELDLMVESEFPAYGFRIFAEDYSGNAPVVFDNLVFSIGAIEEYIYRESAETSLFRFSLISKAHACSPIPLSTTEKLVDFNVTSSHDFDEANPAGASLNSFFNVIYTESESDFYEGTTFDDGSHGVSFFSLEEYMSQEVVMAGDIIQLRLNTRPQNLERHIFFINISLDTGESFFLETPEISFVDG